MCLFLFRHYLSVFYFQNDLNKIVVNIETPKKDDIHICFKGNCDKMNYENNVYFYKLNQQNSIFYLGAVDDIELISKNEAFLKDIKKIDTFIGNEYYKIENSNNIQKISFQNQDSYSLLLKIKSNNKTLIQKLGVYFESFFYNWYFFVICYALILIYLIKYQNRFDFKIKYPIFIILLVGIFLRLSHIDFIPLWNDELYSLTYISDLGNKINLKRTFLDAGNPPLFFIISNIWLYFFNKTIFSIRLLPCLIGILQIYLTYFLLNKILNKKIALLASFLCAINIFIILESNEIRSYILAMILVVCGFYNFYRLIQKFNNRNLVFYCLFLVLLINTHYYCVLYAFSNLVLGMFLFKENRWKFLFSNLIAFLTFIPYFLKTVCLQSLNPEFNTWLEKPSFDVLANHITFYFGNLIFFIIVILGSIYLYKKLQKEEKFIFLYNIYSIFMVFVFALLISFFIKPILFERYFCIFLPFLIINTALILNIDFKTKYQPLFFAVIFLFSLNIPKYENFNLFSNINLMMKYSISDSANQKEYDSYFVIPDKIEYSKYFKNVSLTKIIVSNYGVREDIDLLDFYLNKINKKRKLVLYLPEICINSKIKYSKKINMVKINTSIVPIYKIYLD